MDEGDRGHLNLTGINVVDGSPALGAFKICPEVLSIKASPSPGEVDDVVVVVSGKHVALQGWVRVRVRVGVGVRVRVRVMVSGSRFRRCGVTDVWPC